MARIKLSTEKNRDIFLYTSRVENLFISEFMPDAPGEYVKVFLLGLMYAQYDEVMDSRKIAIVLGLSEEEVEEAWIYWASRGVIRRHVELSDDGFEIEYIEILSQIGRLYGKASETETASETAEAEAAAVQPEELAEDGGETDADIYESLDDMDYEDVTAERMTDKVLRDIYLKYQEVTGRTVSRQETGKIADAIRVYGIKPGIFDFAIDYCADLEKYSIDYIFKVALRWTEEGCATVEDAKILLDRHSKRNSYYSQVFRALGFNRLAAPADREIMDRWFDEMDCSIGEVLDACKAAAGLRDPNLRYVNKVLENRRLEKGGVNTRAETEARRQAGTGYAPAGERSLVSRKVLSDYFEYIRGEEEESQRARIREIRRNIPEMEEVFAAEKELNARLLSIKPGEGSREARGRLKEERRAAEERKRELLSGAGYPEDYLERRYRCGICKDTGYTDEGMVCSCCKTRAEEAYKWIGANRQA